MYIVFLIKKSQGECNTQPQTGAESELPQEGPFWCATLRFSLALSSPPYENVLGAPLLGLVGAHFSLIIPEEAFVYWFIVQVADFGHHL